MFVSHVGMILLGNLTAKANLLLLDLSSLDIVLNSQGIIAVCISKESSNPVENRLVCPYEFFPMAKMKPLLPISALSEQQMATEDSYPVRAITA